MPASGSGAVAVEEAPTDTRGSSSPLPALWDELGLILFFFPDMLTLYFAPGASSMAPHIALHEIGVPFESRPVSLARKETRTPAYLALNPEGKVPTLLIDGRPLTEVAAIVVYLSKRFPEAGLLPEGDIEAEAQAISWMSFLAATIGAGPSGGAQQGVDRVQAAFGIADRRMGNEWALGSFSVGRTSTCSGCIGVSTTRFIRHPENFPTSPRTTSA